MVTVDCHLHLTDSAEQAPIWWMEELYRPYGGGYIWTDGEAIVGILDRAGVDMGMVQGSDIRRTTYHPDFPDQRHVFVPNDYTAEQVALFPDRLIGVANIDPLRDVRAGVIEQRRCVEDYGFRSSKFLPTYQNYYIDDPAVAPMLESCLELDIVAHVNTGYSPTITAALRYGHPERLDRVGIRYRDLRVLVYINFPYVDEGIAVVARHPNFHADIAYFMGAGPGPLFDALDKLRGLGALGRVLYGSDNNDKDRTGGGQQIGTQLLGELNEVADRTGREPFTTADIDGIVSGNAQRLYKLD
ncbi:MAG: amidohydrolase family protein [bacterium]|nr:amidohydrolase family protein [bacterium]MDE0353298.1 amidohydrolase family protein [bacterium]